MQVKSKITQEQIYKMLKINYWESEIFMVQKIIRKIFIIKIYLIKQQIK